MTYENADILSKAILDLWGVQEILDALSAQALEDSSALRILSREVDKVANTIEGVINTMNDDGAGAVEALAPAASMSANCE